MQNAYKHQANTLKTWMQHDNMRLHAKLSKFHIEHAQNGATVQHTHSTSLKDKLSKTATRHIASIKTTSYSIPTSKKRHGHEVQVKHDKR